MLFCSCEVEVPPAKAWWCRDPKKLLPNRWIGCARRLVCVYVCGDGVRVDVVVVLAGCSYSFGYLRVSINCVARLLRWGFGNDLQRENITFHHRSGAVISGIQQVLLAHFFKRTKAGALMSVVIEHLLLRDCSQTLNGSRFICSLDRGLPTG